MKRLSEEKLKILTEKFGWSMARAEGYVAGETSRRSGTVASTYALVGIDDYCVGFRAGFFVRQPLQRATQIPPGEKPQAFLVRLDQVSTRRNA